MKIKYLLCFFAFAILCACNKKDVLVSDPKVDFNSASVKLMDSIRPALYGTWQMQEVKVVPFQTSVGEIGIYKDTVLKNLATLTINHIDYNTNELYRRQNDVTGTLTFGSKTYPVGFTMNASANRIYHKTGPQVFGLFEYRFPSGLHITEKEEMYLIYLTLIGENFEMQLSDDGKSMQWKGLNRAIKNIQLVKK